jgi:hypothetical protein
MTGQPQPDRASSLLVDQVHCLHATRLTQIAGRPREAAPKRRRAALSLVPQPKPSQQPPTPTEETR